MRAASASRAGAERSGNQDRAWIDLAAGRFGVSDGVGGNPGGEVAAELALEACGRGLSCPPAGATTPRARLVAALQEAARALHARGRRERMLGRMAATLTLLELEGSAWRVVHVGDSRAYLLRGPVLTQLTRDHSVAFEQFLAGAITKEALAEHPNQKLLTRTLSATRPFVVGDVTEGQGQAGDLLLLCTDGLSTALPDPELAAILSAERADPERACARLIEGAAARGGKDDMTALVVLAEW